MNTKLEQKHYFLLSTKRKKYKTVARNTKQRQEIQNSGMKNIATMKTGKQQ